MASHKYGLCLLLGLLAGNVSAADRAWWQFWRDSGGDVANSATQQLVSRNFTPEQQRLLRDFLVAEQRRSYHDDSDGGHGKDKAKSLPPGLQKKLARGGDLPPGWQKKLARGEVIDSQVWGHARNLPPDLLYRLGPMPADLEIRYLEDRVFSVIRDSREIIDILGL